MIESPYLSWVLTALFAATGLWSLMRCVRSFAGLPVPGITGRISCAVCAVMSAAMIGMSWSWGMSLPAWPQVAVFALATLWFVVLATRPRLGSVFNETAASRLPHVHNALMMATVVWMILTIPASMAMGDRAPHAMASTMAGLSPRTTSLTLVSVLLAAYFLLAALSWFFRAVASHKRKRALTYDAFGHAAMSLGMGAMLLVMA